MQPVESIPRNTSLPDSDISTIDYPSSTDVKKSSDSAVSQCASPASRFEVSSSFFPELYTTGRNPLTIRIFTFSAFQENEACHSRTYSYGLFFMRSPRQWRRLTLSIIIPRQSKFWDYPILPPPQRNNSWFAAPRSLPKPFQVLLENSIAEVEDFRDDLNLSLDVSDDKENQARAA